MGRIDGGILENFTPAKNTSKTSTTGTNFDSEEHLDFKNNDNSVWKIMKVKDKPSVGLPNQSDQLPDDSNADQSQGRRGTKARRY